MSLCWGLVAKCFDLDFQCFLTWSQRNWHNFFNDTQTHMHTIFPSWCSVAKVPPPGTVDSLSTPSKRSTTLKLGVVPSPCPATRSTRSPAWARSWTLAGNQFGRGVWGESSLCCYWTDQEGCLALEDFLLGKIWWGVYVCLWFWSLTPTKLGTLFTASYSKVGTDSAMAVTLQDPEETRLAPKRTPRVLHLPELEAWDWV